MIPMIFSLDIFSLVSYNEPELPGNATWHPCGTTFVDESRMGGRFHGIFIDSNNTIYVAAHDKNEVVVWNEGNSNPISTIPLPLFFFSSLFVIEKDEIYFETVHEKGRIDKWDPNFNQSFSIAKFSESCFGFFIDLNNTVYCSMRVHHKVDKVWLDGDRNATILVAGTGSPGSAVNELRSPYGIFVDTDFNLYVADSDNHRILLFQYEQKTGVVVAGNGFPGGLSLSLPTDVILDRDKVLYIADNENNRIIRVNKDQYDCIIGCSRQQGAGPDQFHKSYALRFDSYGNLYVIDEFNHRLQKFILQTDPPGSYSDENVRSENISVSFYRLCRFQCYWLTL